MSKISVNAAELNAAIRRLAPAIQMNPVLPIYDSVKANIAGGIAHLFASCGSISIATKIEVLADGDMVFSLPFMAQKFIRTLDGPITLSTKNQTLTIVHGAGRASFQFDDPSAFPIQFDPIEVEAGRFEARQMRDALKAASFAFDDEIYPLSGLAFKDGLVFSGDRNRSNVSCFPCGFSGSVVFPSTVKTIFGETLTDSVRFEQRENGVVFSDGITHVFHVASTIKNWAAAVEGLLSKIDFRNQHSVLRSDFEAALSRMAISVSGFARTVRLSFTKDALLMMAEDVDFASKAEETLASTGDAEFEYALNIDNLRTIVSTFKDAFELHFMFDDEKNPIKILGARDDAFFISQGIVKP